MDVVEGEGNIGGEWVIRAQTVKNKAIPERGSIRNYHFDGSGI
jgi:hypothetical protein